MSALTAWGHQLVDATAGAVIMTLPTGQASGTEVKCEKVDATGNAVTLTGNVRGIANSSLSLTLKNESVTQRADSSGSWWPVADHKPMSQIAQPRVHQAMAGYPNRALRRAHYALAARNSEPCDVFICAGDSITASYGTSTRANSLAVKLVNYLRTAHPQTAAGGAGFLSAEQWFTGIASPVPDSPLTETVTSHYNPFAGAPGQGLDSAMVSLTKTGDKVSWSFTGTGFNLPYFWYGNPGGAVALTVDGTNYGTLTAVNPSGGTGSGAYYSITAGSGNIPQTAFAGNLLLQGQVRGLTAGSHTVSLTWVSGSFYVLGLFAFNGDETAGIRIAQQAWPGRGTRNFVGSAYGTGTQSTYPQGGVGTVGTGGVVANNSEQWLQHIVQGYYLPDIVILDNQANDYSGYSTDLCSVAENLSNLKSIIAQVKAAVVKGCAAQGLTSYVPSFVVMPVHCICTSNPGSTNPSITSGAGTMVDYWANYVANMYTLAATDPDGAVAVFDLGQRLQSPSNTWDQSTYQGLLWTDKVHPSDVGTDWIARSLATFLTAA